MIKGITIVPIKPVLKSYVIIVHYDKRRMWYNDRLQHATEEQLLYRDKIHEYISLCDI